MQSSFHSTGGKPTVLRPDVDVVLSLKNSVYKSVMFDCFVRLGGKKNDQNNDAEKESARDALWVLRGRSKVGDRPARFFKPESRYASRSFVEVDESLAHIGWNGRRPDFRESAPEEVEAAPRTCSTRSGFFQEEEISQEDAGISALPRERR